MRILGAMISCTRPKYDVVIRAASNADWLAKLRVSEPTLFWFAASFRMLWTSAMNETPWPG